MSTSSDPMDRIIPRKKFHPTDGQRQGKRGQKGDRVQSSPHNSSVWDSRITSSWITTASVKMLCPQKNGFFLYLRKIKKTCLIVGVLRKVKIFLSPVKLCIGCSLLSAMLQTLTVAIWLRVEVVNMTIGVAENIVQELQWMFTNNFLSEIWLLVLITCGVIYLCRQHKQMVTDSSEKVQTSVILLSVSFLVTQSKLEGSYMCVAK